MARSKTIEAFNPLDKTNLGESVAEALLKQPVSLLPPEESFYGAGVYTIYYKGDFAAYSEITKHNHDDNYRLPIYVGKAVPAGARKGSYGLDADPGTALYRRLAEHAASIEQTDNLQLEDFRCRYLVVDDIWIPLAESLMISMFSPLWNLVVDGFGNHDPGKGRYQQERSLWDTLHPGRAWARKLRPRAEEKLTVQEMLAQYYVTVPCCSATSQS